jgi:predicted kinase
MGHAAAEAAIFVGIQGSGKTTFYRQRLFDTHVRISLDMLHTRRREQLLMATCLEARQSFVIDNTNPSPEDRARYIERARRAGFRVVAYFFETSLGDAIRRNQQRPGKQNIPIPGIHRTFLKLKAPVLSEGFEAIYTVRIVSNQEFVVSDAGEAAGL